MNKSTLSRDQYLSLRNSGRSIDICYFEFQNQTKPEFRGLDPNTFVTLFEHYLHMSNRSMEMILSDLDRIHQCTLLYSKDGRLIRVY